MNLLSIIAGQRKNGTYSRFYVDDCFYGYVIEHPLRPVKIINETGIPCGSYSVYLTWSPDYSKLYGNQKVPEIIIPGWTGIRIHAGNFINEPVNGTYVGQNDSEGCQMIGSAICNSPDGLCWFVVNTSDLSHYLNLSIIKAIKSGEVVNFTKKLS